MAVLKSGDWSFDFRYTGFAWGWVQYQFYFLWKDEPVIRDSALRREGTYWGDRAKSAFLANEDEADGFLPFLKNVLKSDTADYWEPIEPDIVVAVYPDEYFPFLKSHLQLVYESDESKQQREAREKLKEEKGQLPDDLYTFIAMVDAYNFKDADAYYGQGLSIHLMVERQELEAFVNDLEVEYGEFKRRFNVDAHKLGAP
jgi:hypothetical protein